MPLDTRMLLSPSLEETEDAILAQLRADAELSTYLGDSATFSGSVTEALQEGQYRLPAALVLFGGYLPDEEGPLRYRMTAEWFVLVLCRSLRSEDARRRPVRSEEVGAYRMVQDVQAALSLQDLGLDGLGSLRPAGCELVTTGVPRDRSLAVYQIAFTAEHRLAPAPVAQDLEGAVVLLSTTDPDGGAWSPTVEATLPLEP